MATTVPQSDKIEEKAQPGVSKDTNNEPISDDQKRSASEAKNGLLDETIAPAKDNPDSNNDFLKGEGNVQISVPSRPGGDGGNNKDDGIDEVDNVLRVPAIAPSYPGTIAGSSEIPDINFYQHKKTLAKGMMDLALFSANANQLRYVLECADRHPYYYPSMLLIVFSLICQVGVGIALLWNAMYNVKHEMEQANRANNFTVIGIFLVTVINVFVSAFGVANPPPLA